MKTLQDDIDDLDRMVDTDATKDAIRSQIRLISREVAALEADYARLAQSHSELDEAHTKFKTAQSERDAQSVDQLVDSYDFKETYRDPTSE